MFSHWGSAVVWGRDGTYQKVESIGQPVFTLSFGNPGRVFIGVRSNKRLFSRMNIEDLIVLEELSRLLKKPCVPLVDADPTIFVIQLPRT